MIRLIALFAYLYTAAAQDKPALHTRPDPDAPAKGQEAAPPEEDEDLKPEQFSFNPLQANKEVRIGNYYFKKGNYRAAAKRFERATKWNPALAEAYLRWGDAGEKMSDTKSMRAAYAKYLELAPDAKNAAAIRKKLEQKH